MKTVKTVEVITPPRLGGPYTWAKELNSALNRQNEKTWKSTHVKSYCGVASSLLWQKPTVYHTTIPFLPLAKKGKMIMTVHGEFTIENPLWRARYWRAIPRVDAVTLPSKFLQERLMLEDPVIIPNAIDTKRFRGRDWKDSKDSIELCTMASLYFKDKSSGILKIMKMLNEIRKDGSNVRYTVMGAGQYLEMLKKEAEKLELPVRFTGYHHNPGEIMSKSDGFLYYSTHDNFPLALLEAMACGIPVLTNKVGAVSEIFDSGHDGFVAISDTDYEKQLKKLIQTKELRKKVGKEAYTSVRKKFDWDIVAPKFIELYEQ